MAKLKTSNLTAILGDKKIDKKQKASTSLIVCSELNNLFNDMKIMLLNQNIEDSIKYILWQGLLNRYGIFGYQRNNIRKFGKEQDITYSDKTYECGDLLSIDFGTSNFGNEFSFTHSAYVVSDFTDYIIVVPITSCGEGRLESKPLDGQEATILLSKEEFKVLANDSYALTYQIRSVTKSRITKYIGNIDCPKLAEKIFSNIFKKGVDKLKN
jgi:mRNA-degrading endonuclease toxin of MazEF toxin-antitoxin module